MRIWRKCVRDTVTIPRTSKFSPSKYGHLTALRLTSICLLVFGCAVVAVVRAHNHGNTNPGLPTVPMTAGANPQNNRAISGSNLSARLSLQPEANRFRRKLGQRFVATGHERATITGIVKVGGQQYQVRVVRSQSEDGEAVGIDLNGSSLSWNATEGARSGTSGL